MILGHRGSTRKRPLFKRGVLHLTPGGYIEADGVPFCVWAYARYQSKRIPLAGLDFAYIVRPDRR